MVCVLDEIPPSSAPEGWVCATPLPGSGVMSLPRGPSQPSPVPQTPGLGRAANKRCLLQGQQSLGALGKAGGARGSARLWFSHSHLKRLSLGAFWVSLTLSLQPICTNLLFPRETILGHPQGQ